MWGEKKGVRRTFARAGLVDVLHREQITYEERGEKRNRANVPERPGWFAAGQNS